MIALLEMKPEYAIPRTDLENKIISSKEFINKRKKILKKCLEEEKSVLSKGNGDVGINIAQEYFQDNFFGGWDDGFLASYKHIVPIKNGEKLDICRNPDLFKIQAMELLEFVERYKIHVNNSTNLKTSEKLDFNNAFWYFDDRYGFGWKKGFKAGFCGLSCFKRDCCGIAEKYSIRK